LYRWCIVNVVIATTMSMVCDGCITYRKTKTERKLAKNKPTAGWLLALA